MLSSASLPDRLSEQDSPLLDQLLAGCEVLGLAPSARQAQQLMEYLALLEKWNHAYNLTAVRDPETMVTRHLLDSLAILPFLPDGPCIDVGTGAGLPGVPLAIMRPDTAFTLLDSNGKKTRFLFQVKTALALDNMAVRQARVEAFQAEQGFNAVTSRAFATLSDMFAGCRHLLAERGQCFAMKGANPGAELDALLGTVQADTITAEIHPLVVPGLDEARHLVTLAITA